MDRINKFEKNQEEIVKRLQDGLGREEQHKHRLASKLHHIEISVLNLSYSLNYGNRVNIGDQQSHPGNGFGNFVHNRL